MQHKRIITNSIRSDPTERKRQHLRILVQDWDYQQRSSNSTIPSMARDSIPQDSIYNDPTIQHSVCHPPELQRVPMDSIQQDGVYSDEPSSSRTDGGEQEVFLPNSQCEEDDQDNIPLRTNANERLPSEQWNRQANQSPVVQHICGDNIQHQQYKCHCTYWDRYWSPLSSWRNLGNDMGH